MRIEYPTQVYADLAAAYFSSEEIKSVHTAIVNNTIESNLNI